MKKIIFFIALVGITKANAQEWSQTGNAGTNPSVNFIGTTDLHSFVIRSNNASRIFVDSLGKVGIGTSAPTAHLHFNGGKFILNATSTGNSSLIKIKSLLEIQNGSITFAVFDAVNQRVGIGTTTPATPLDVNGTITAAGGNSANWNAAFGWGNHAAAGYVITENDPQIGAVATSYVPRWNGSALATGSIYDNITAVGIGTTSVGDCKFAVQQSSATIATSKFLNTTKGANISWIHFGNNGDWFIRSAANAGNVILQDQAAGTVCIGTTSPAAGFKLSVYGKIIAEEIRVKLAVNWPDFVFAEDYHLMPVEELKNHIALNNHLPGIPSAAEMEAQGGADLGEMQQKLLQKIEELTLYIIKQQEEINALSKKVDNR